MADDPDSSSATRFDDVTLRLVLTVASTGSIRAASESLNLSPSAISRRLAELERDFGQTFFARTSRGVEVTEAGQVMVDKAREIFAAIDGARAEMRRLVTGETGVLVLSANGSAFVNGLARDLARFRNLHPGISIGLFEQTSPEVVSSVLTGKTRLGLIARTFRLPKEIETRLYCTDRLVLAVPRDHPLEGQAGVALTDIRAFGVIGVIEGSSMSRLIRRASVLGNAELQYRYMANSNEVARTLVAHGHGVAILPENFVAPYAGVLPIALVPINESWAQREISLIRHADIELTRSETNFWNFLKDPLQASAPTV